jgi:hypothetical protein
MGYETKIYLAEQFTDRWVPKSEFYSKSNPDLDRLPDDAMICTDFVSIAELDLCKCDYDGHVHKFFEKGRKKQRKVKRYASVVYEGFTHVDGEHAGEQDQYAVLVDRYDDPLGVHDPRKLLDVLRKEIEEDITRGEQPYRRFVLAEAMLAACLESGLVPLKRLAAQAKKARVKKEDWLFPRLVVLSFGY